MLRKIHYCIRKIRILFAYRAGPHKLYRSAIMAYVVQRTGSFSCQRAASFVQVPSYFWRLISFSARRGFQGVGLPGVARELQPRIC